MKKLICLLPALLAICSLTALAQTETATMSGRVTDPQGAVVAGADVQATNIDTNVTTSTKTNSSGIYLIPSLQPGNYRLTIKYSGFKEIVKTGLTLHVQDTVSQNFALEVGSTQETVTVTGGAPLVNTQDAAVSTVVDRQFAENLPMNGRSFQTLIELTPGVVITATNAADNGQFVVNGQRAASNYWMVDGVSANIGIGGAVANPANGLAGAVGSFSAAGGTNSLVSVDALQEFRIQTSTYAPEFGRTPGGQISIVTRSGTNQFHGTAFDYLRNDVLDATNWFNGFCTPGPKCPLPKPKERQNDFGGTFSGPIFKNRMFFFFSYEGLRLRLPQTALTTVPDASARQAAVPAMQPFLNAYPLPNGPEDPAHPGAAQFNSSYSNPSTLDAYSLRVDQKVGSKWALFGRYNYSPSELSQRGNGGALSRVDSTRITTQTATLGATWAISTAVVNDVRFNYSRTNASGASSLDNFGGATPLTSSPFPVPFTFASAALQFNPISLTQGTLNAGPTVRNLQRQINIVDGLSVQKGTHDLKLGLDFRRLSPQFEQAAYKQLVLFLNMASAENGDIAFGSVSSTATPTFLFRNLGIYAQDTWRIVPRLTATYGVRWDVDFVPESLDGPSLNSVTGFNLSDLSKLALAAAGTAPYETTYNNFAPRIGLAYQLRTSPGWQTVLRGGFGTFYDLGTSEVGNGLGSTYPFGGQTILFGGKFPLRSAPPPAITQPSAANTQILSVFDPGLKLPYTLEWNVAVEQSLGKQQIITASYVGAAGRRLLQTAKTVSATSLNTSFPNLSLVTNTGSSDYNALQLQFERRLSRGLQANVSYTWAHSIDTGSSGSTLSSNALLPAALSANRGPSDFDIRNALSAGVTYDLPAPKRNAIAKAVLQGWSVQNLILDRSASPVTVVTGFLNGVNFTNFDGFFTLLRPDLVPGKPLYLFGPQYPGGKALNPAAFAAPPVDPVSHKPIRNGNLARNALRGFGATQWDFAVHRDFPIRESLKLQFRAELFNVLNHPNFGQPDNSLSDATFGKSTQMLGQYLSGGAALSLGGGGFSPLYQIGGPRSVQFALKLMF